MHKMILVSLWHGLPLIPIFLDLPILAIAALLAVCLPYIKVKKLNQFMQRLKAHEDMDQNEYQSLKRTRDFWLRLTFWN